MDGCVFSLLSPCWKCARVCVYLSEEHFAQPSSPHLFRCCNAVQSDFNRLVTAVTTVEAAARFSRTKCETKKHTHTHSETMLKSRGGLESDQQVVRKSVAAQNVSVLLYPVARQFKEKSPRKCVFKISSEFAGLKAVSARIRISAVPSLLAIYFLLCLLNFDSAFGCRQLFQTQSVLSAQTMRKARLKKKKELLSRGRDQRGAIMAQSRSLLLFIKWQRTLSVPRLPSLPLCLIL